MKIFGIVLTSLLVSHLMSACSVNIAKITTEAPPISERLHDNRVFTPSDPTATTFDALTPTPTDKTDVTKSQRFAGVLNGAAYRIEVPQDWNGNLVMYTHGYRGNTDKLTVENPLIRRHILENGFAWAASSYSKNYYDARAGIEDTNLLALNFNNIVNAKGLSFKAPSKYYIMGYSMGGHIAAAAVEAETWADSNHKVRYSASMPMCGVVAPYEQFNTVGAMYVSARAIAGYPDISTAPWNAISKDVTTILFSSFPTAESPQTPIIPTEKGKAFVSVLKNLTGGDRPLFDMGLANGGSFIGAYGSFGEDRQLAGILNKDGLDTTHFTYVIDNKPNATAKLNREVAVVSSNKNFNPKRNDGLRWMPAINGEIEAPVLSLHTLGDLLVPFSLQQHYANQVKQQGNEQNLVQRAMRGISHCDFTEAEVSQAFDDLITWESQGIKAKGDKVLDPTLVADKHYGCTFTDNTTGVDDRPIVKNIRKTLDKVASCL